MSMNTCKYSVVSSSFGNYTDDVIRNITFPYHMILTEKYSLVLLNKFENNC